MGGAAKSTSANANANEKIEANSVSSLASQEQEQERRALKVKAGKARAAQFTPEYQKAAGNALKEKVCADYYRHIGRLGGRKTMYQLLLRIAGRWNFSQAEIAASRVSEQKRDELVAGMRQHYRQEAEGYASPWGNRVSLECFPPGSGKPYKRKRNGKEERKAKGEKS